MTTRTSVLARLVLAAGLISTTLAAQNAPSPGQQAPPAGAPAQQKAPAGQGSAQEGVQLPQGASQPTFRLAIDLVTTDVIVRDGNGQFAADLNKEDFEILEDGVKQEVASLVLVHGGRVLNQLLPPPPPPQEGIILPPPRPTNDAAGRIFLFVVDDLHMNFRDTSRIRQLFKKMAKELVHDGDMFGVVSSGTSSIAIDLTYDQKRLDEAANKIMGSALKPSEIIEAGGRGPDGLSELKYRAHTAFSTMYDIVGNLERVHNRRKAVILISNGYDLNPFEGARYGDPNIIGQKYESPGQILGTESSSATDYDPFSRQSAQFSDADLIREISELTKAANRANATIYTIDPRGLVAGSDLDEQVDPTEWNNYVRKSQDSLRVLADLTGGFAAINSNDYTKALKRIDAETSDYYVLGYYSTNPDPTKRRRKLEVKTTRPNMEVWSRQSYSLKLPPAPKKPNKDSK
jgi:VWFA-related protein